MGTIGEQVIERLNAIERRLDIVDRNGVGAQGIPAGMDELQQEITQIRQQLDSLPNASFGSDRPRNKCRKFYRTNIATSGEHGATKPESGSPNMTQACAIN